VVFQTRTCLALSISRAVLARQQEASQLISVSATLEGVSKNEVF
jgi:hypothetical protein